MIISIINQKGGVGKTVTAINLGTALARVGERVLLIDADLQHSLSSHLDIDVRDRGSLVDVLFDGMALLDAAVPVRENLSVVPSHPRMESADRELPHMRGGVLRLAHAMKAAGGAGTFDLCLIDCPSGWGATVENAVLASDFYIMPVNCEPAALESALEVERKIEELRTYYNHEAQLLGVLLTCYRHTNSAHSVVESARSLWPQTFDAMVRRVEKINELSAFRETVFDGPASRAASARADYQTLAKEVLQKCRPTIRKRSSRRSNPHRRAPRN